MWTSSLDSSGNEKFLYLKMEENIGAKSADVSPSTHRTGKLQGTESREWRGQGPS